MRTETEHINRLKKLDALRNTFIKRYEAIYAEEGLDEDYLEAYLTEIQSTIFPNRVRI